MLICGNSGGKAIGGRKCACIIAKSAEKVKGEEKVRRGESERRDCPYKYAIVMKNRRPTSKCQPYFTLSFAGKSEKWAKRVQAKARGNGEQGPEVTSHFF